jgi:hypothetical protein
MFRHLTGKEAKRLSLFCSEICPIERSHFYLIQGEEILVQIKTICTLLDQFGNDSKKSWFVFQNDIGTFLLSFLTLLAAGTTATTATAAAATTAAATTAATTTSYSASTASSCCKSSSNQQQRRQQRRGYDTHSACGEHSAPCPCPRAHRHQERASH